MCLKYMKEGKEFSYAYKVLIRDKKGNLITPYAFQKVKENEWNKAEKTFTSKTTKVEYSKEHKGKISVFLTLDGIVQWFSDYKDFEVWKVICKLNTKKPIVGNQRYNGGYYDMPDSALVDGFKLMNKVGYKKGAAWAFVSNDAFYNIDSHELTYIK